MLAYSTSKLATMGFCVKRYTSYTAAHWNTITPVQGTVPNTIASRAWQLHASSVASPSRRVRPSFRVKDHL